MQIRSGLQPGDAGDIIRWHGLLYNREYGFDASFEAYVAVPLAEFIQRCDEREAVWVAREAENFRGCIAIVRASARDAQLRWLIVRPESRGRGLGRRLAAEALSFCRENKYRRVMLWTVDILPAAAALYRSLGFSLVETRPRGLLWGRNLVEEKYEMTL